MKPRPFQQDAVQRLSQGSYGLFWKPGVGKTLPLALASAQQPLPTLWLTLPDLRAQATALLPVLRGDKPRIQTILGRRVDIDTRADVVVCSYDLMREPAIWRQLFRQCWGAIVCDEAQALKSSASIRTQAFYGKRQESPGALFRRSSNVWLATGTPIMRDPMDLWPHVSRLWPDYLPQPRTKDGWMNHHCVTRPGQYGPVVVAARRPDELKAMLNTVGDIRELDLDARLDVDTIRVEISHDERRMLEDSLPAEEWRLLESLFAEIDGGDERAEMALKGRLLGMTGLRRALGVAKARSTALLAAAELDGGVGQMIIWGHHREPLQYLTTALAKYGSALMNGDTPRAGRERIKADYIAGKIRVLVANTQVGGTGLDGFQCSQRCLLMEPDWLPGPNEQAIARQYRQGQRHPVHASLIVVVNSPDETIARVIERRAKMITASTGTEAHEN